MDQSSNLAHQTTVGAAPAQPSRTEAVAAKEEQEDEQRQHQQHQHNTISANEPPPKEISKEGDSTTIINGSSSSSSNGTAPTTAPPHPSSSTTIAVMEKLELLSATASAAADGTPAPMTAAYGHHHRHHHDPSGMRSPTNGLMMIGASGIHGSSATSTPVGLHHDHHHHHHHHGSSASASGRSSVGLSLDYSPCLSTRSTVSVLGGGGGGGGGGTSFTAPPTTNTDLASVQTFVPQPFRGLQPRVSTGITTGAQISKETSTSPGSNGSNSHIPSPVSSEDGQDEERGVEKTGSAAADGTDAGKAGRSLANTKHLYHNHHHQAGDPYPPLPHGPAGQQRLLPVVSYHQFQVTHQQQQHQQHHQQLVQAHAQTQAQAFAPPHSSSNSSSSSSSSNAPPAVGEENKASSFHPPSALLPPVGLDGSSFSAYSAPVAGSASYHHEPASAGGATTSTSNSSNGIRMTVDVHFNPLITRGISRSASMDADAQQLRSEEFEINGGSSKNKDAPSEGETSVSSFFATSPLPRRSVGDESMVHGRGHHHHHHRYPHAPPPPAPHGTTKAPPSTAIAAATSTTMDPALIHNHPAYQDLLRHSSQLQQQLKEKDIVNSSLQHRVNYLENQIHELRQLPTGKISHIPVDDMIRIMQEYGSEVSSQTLPQRKYPIQKASVVRQFRRWNPEFFRYFLHVNGEWVPKLGKEGELRRRAEKRREFKARSQGK